MLSVPLVLHVGQHASRLWKGSFAVKASPTSTDDRFIGILVSSTSLYNCPPASEAKVLPEAANHASIEPSSLIMIEGP